MPVRDARWQALRLALGTASALGLARFAYGLLLPAMREDLHWTLSEAGTMSAANGLGYLLGALLTAVAVRRVGTAVTFRRGMILTAVSLAATAASDHFLALLATRAAAGVAGAAVFITGGVIASHLATRATSGAPITIYFAGTGLGIVFSGVTIPPLAGQWRLAWLGLSVAAAVTALIRANTPPADWTATLAVFTTLFSAGQTAGPWLAGLLADHTSTNATLAWTAALCAAAALIASRSRLSAAPWPGVIETNA